MLRHTHHHRLLATVAAAAVLAATAPAALARPIDTAGPTPEPVRPTPEPVHVVRVQVDEGLDWTDAGIGAAGMLALVLIGYGGARAVQPRGPRALSH
jgi:hypothetical protein